MIRPALFAVVAVSLAACARPGPAQLSPAAAGEYEFDGFVEGVGQVSGRFGLDETGAVSGNGVSAECPGLPTTPGVSVSCQLRIARLARDAGQQANRAAVVVRVTERSASAEGCYQSEPVAGEPSRCVASQGRTNMKQRSHRGVVEVRRAE